MSEPSRKRPRTTPRNSGANASAAGAASITPFNDLHQLGKIVHKPNTPQHRTPQKPPSVSQATAARTPKTSSLTPTIRSATRFAVRRGQPRTPHAIRALQQRRNAALTPSRDRRRSGRVQRETPREDLRKLSRLMAKHSKPLEPSPRVEVLKKPIWSTFPDEEDDENEPPPRLSMPLNEQDEDSWHEAPPRLSLPLDGDETQTVRSVEGARRALFDKRRESGGNLSYMDRTAALLDEMLEGEPEGEEEDPRPLFSGIDVAMDDDLDPITDGEATGELRVMLGSANQGRISRISPSERSPPPLSDGDPTFQFRFPDRRQSAVGQPHYESEPEVDIQSEAEVDKGDIEEDYNTETGDEEVAVLTSTRNVIPTAAPDSPATASKPSSKAPTKELKVSKHGLPYPSLPSSVVKRIATTFSRSYTGSSKLSKETLLAIEEASDWFFEQVSEDVAMYSDHAGRRTIEETDVVTLMGRQKLVGKGQTLFSLAQKFLPRELVGEIRMAPTNGKKKGKKRKKMVMIAEEDEEETTA